MTAKEFILLNRLVNDLLKGVVALARAVKVPWAHVVVMLLLEKSFGAPTITKDGVSVAKEIEFEDKIQKHGRTNG